MLPYKRSKRVGDLLREQVAEIIQYKLKDPRMGFITVTGVDMTDDLKIAFVYISVLKEEDKQISLEILNSAKSFIRTELGRRIRIKTIPTLEFRIDTSIAYGSRIEELLEKIRRKGEGSI